MSFAPIEESQELGRPVELYLFRYGLSVDQVYGYTDAEKPITFNNVTFQPVPIRRSRIVISGSMDRSTVTVDLPANLPVPDMFRVYAPSSVVRLAIFQGHDGDTDGDFKLHWSGRVLNCRWVDREASLTCEPINTSLTRTGLRRNYQYGCPHVLYDSNTCRASKSAATTQATVQAIEGSVVTLSVTSSVVYAGGYVEWNRPDGRKEIRTIVQIPDGKFQLSGTPTGLSTGMTVNLLKGCDHSLNGCSHHNNIENYGGMPWIPLKNPMSNSSPFR